MPQLAGHQSTIYKGMEAVAKYKNCPMSARKMRIVIDNIRGVEVEKALNILRFTRKEAATWLEKVLVSAIANWEVKAGEDVDADEFGLYVKTAYVDEGPTLKRFRPAPFGRAHRIRKRTNHITIIVENEILLPQEEEGYEEDYEDVGYDVDVAEGEAYDNDGASVDAEELVAVDAEDVVAEIAENEGDNISEDNKA